MEKRQETEINVIEFLFVLLRRWWVIFLAAVFCGSAMFVYTKFMVTPMYRSTAKLYVLPTSENEQPNAQDAQMALSFTKDFQAIAVGRTVLEGVITDLDLKMSYEGLASHVSSTSSEDSRIITISVSHKNPTSAQEIAKAICEEAESVLFSTVEADLVNISEEANLPVSPYAPNMTKNVFIGAFGGIAITCILLFIIFMVDDKIKTPTDIENYLGMSTLGIIPSRKGDDLDENGNVKQQKK